MNPKSPEAVLLAGKRTAFYCTFILGAALLYYYTRLNKNSFGAGDGFLYVIDKHISRSLFVFCLILFNMSRMMGIHAAKRIVLMRQSIVRTLLRFAFFEALFVLLFVLMVFVFEGELSLLWPYVWALVIWVSGSVLVLWGCIVWLISRHRRTDPYLSR